MFWIDRMQSWIVQDSDADSNGDGCPHLYSFAYSYRSNEHADRDSRYGDSNANIYTCWRRPK